MSSQTLSDARQYEKTIGDAVPETDRPLFHLSSYSGWMNDPNGFSFYNGEYHLFYQYFPYDNRWGPMHWAHATSNDLLKWKFQPAALAPDTRPDGRNSKDLKALQQQTLGFATSSKRTATAPQTSPS